jgi:hypothetical protein
MSKKYCKKSNVPFVLPLNKSQRTTALEQADKMKAQKFVWNLPTAITNKSIEVLNLTNSAQFRNPD